MPELAASGKGRMSAGEISVRVRKGDLSAIEVVDAALGRIREVEGEVGAYLEIFEDDARERAAELDRRVQEGETLGSLAGVPVALKDNLSLAGRALTCGSKILAGYRAPFSATAVERLLAADAVPVGKTNLDEFAMGSSCENSGLQITRNPWSLDRVPGGSSGGSAAAVASGSVPLALGSDTGGSIRQPAAFCGAVGLKPTYGRVSRWGLVSFGSSLDQIGPIATTVSDAALALSVIAGADPRDATRGGGAANGFDAEIDGGPGDLEGTKIGVLAEVDASELPASARGNWNRDLEILAGLGAELVEISVPSLGAAVAVYYVVANCEASANLARFDGLRYGRRARGSDDLLDLYFASRSQGFGAEVKRRIMLGTFALASGYYEAYYGRAQGVREGLRRQFEAVFEKVDLVVTPTTPGPAFGLGERLDDPLSMYLSDVFTTPASLVGLPAVAVPSGLDESGLPLSLQIMGRPWEDAAVLRAALAFEGETGWRLEPPFSNPPHEAS